LLDTLPPPPTPKWLIGFSDITALHCYFNHQFGWPSLHAPMPGQVINQKVDLASVEAIGNLLHSTPDSLHYALTPLNHSVKQTDALTGSIHGGNLCVLQSLLGTPWNPQLDGAILFLEDVDEDTRRLHRMLVHLHQAGMFNHLHGVILGDFNRIPEKEDCPPLEPMLENFCQTCIPEALPVYRISGIGHTERNLPLPLGIPASITNDTLIIPLGGNHV
ncbi:MAG: LD-carboxypeptidase, partial [Rickettsiales bacterium]|nr:LD-carboxypeptidase [Rickettsiales bacterium]